MVLFLVEAGARAYACTHARRVVYTLSPSSVGPPSHGARDARDGRWGLEAKQTVMSVGQRIIGWGIPPSERRRVNGPKCLVRFWGEKREMGDAGDARERSGSGGREKRDASDGESDQEKRH